MDPDLERDHGHVKAAMDAVYSKVLLSLQDSTLKLPGDVAEVLEVAHKLPQRGERLPRVTNVPLPSSTSGSGPGSCGTPSCRRGTPLKESL